MYSRGMATLIVALCLTIAGVGLGIATLLGAFSPVMPADLAALGDFNRIHVAATGEMRISQSGAPSIAIDASPNDLRRLRVYTRNKTLFIEHRNDWLARFASTDAPIHYVVNVDRLAGLDIVSGAEVRMDGLTADSFALTVDGLGNVVIEDVDVERWQANLTGGGHATLTGVAVDQALSISGAGEYDAGDLQTETARVQLAGNSTATLRVTLALDAEIMGNGQLIYYGNPTVSKRLSGLGGIEHLGSR